MFISQPDITQNTDLVNFTVKVNGQEVQRGYRFLRVEVSRGVNRIPSAILVISDGDPSSQTFPASSSEVFIPGNEIEIMAGYHSELVRIFKGIIISHGIKISNIHASQLVVECRDAAFRLTVGRKTRLFDDSADSDAIASILTACNLQNDVAATTDIHEKIVQYNATDWDFINMRAEMNGMFVFANDGSVEVKRFDTSLEPVIPVVFGANIIAFEAGIDARNQFNGVKSQSWDSAGMQIFEMDGTAEGIATSGNFTPRQLSQVSGLDFLILRHSGQITENELKAWSDAILTRSLLAMNTGKITINGHASLKPGDMISLNGLGSRFNGNAPLSAVRHVIDEGTWFTHLVYGVNFETFAQRFKENLAENPASGLVPPVFGLQTGIVMKLENDPKSEYRIKVKIPAFSMSDEGLWARLATPVAGNGYGFIFRPEIGSEVVVGFMNDDPRNPVVLGSMHSSWSPAYDEATDDNYIKTLITRGGVKIQINDDRNIVEVATPNGNSLKMDESAGEVTLNDNNNNQMKFSADGIFLESGGNISIKSASGDISIEAINLNLSATSSLKAEGSAGLEATSSAVLKIQGSIVQIN